MLGSWLTFIPATITAAVGLAGVLGLAKYLIEPWHNAHLLRRKYATALWIACEDLRIRLERVNAKVSGGDHQTTDALKKIPNEDAKDNKGIVRPDWFAKDGYYTTSTAYKIAAVAAWLRIYQRELLFLPYSASQDFLSKLYTAADQLNEAFSGNTCLWYDYLNAVGDGLIVRSGAIPESSNFAPISFAEFCERYARDSRFLLFYEQVHMYLWFVADRQQSYLDSVQQVLQSLHNLGSLLKKEKLLCNDFVVRRPDIDTKVMIRRVQ